MNISYNWLQDYVKCDMPSNEMAEFLTMAGLEIGAVEKVGEDVCFEAEITANRPDWLSHLGVARELAAMSGVVVKEQICEISCIAEKASEAISVDIQAEDLCPRYTAHIIRGVKIAPSPQWLQDKLTTIGLRPINNIVDITNFVLFEYGQPLHAFDYNKINGKKIIVRRAVASEIMKTLDDKEHKLTINDLVIADEGGAVALAGVMGGGGSEVSEQTTDILLESAFFDPVTIRRTARRTASPTDSSYRFERRVDPGAILSAARRAVAMILQLAGGSVLEGVVDSSPEFTEKMPTVELRTARVERVLGVNVPEREIRQYLVGLGLSVVSENEKATTYQIPTYRADLSREIDLIEEIARLHGYNTIPASKTLSTIENPENPQEVLKDGIRNSFVISGYSECITESFVAPNVARAMNPFNAMSCVRVPRAPQGDRPDLRISLIPSLLQVKVTNAHLGTSSVSLFEINHVYHVLPNQALPDEHLKVALLDDRGFLSIKGAVEKLIATLDLEGTLSFTESNQSFLANGVQAEIYIDDVHIGVLGVVTQEAASLVNCKATPAVAELDFTTLLSLKRRNIQYQEIPRFPSIVRDLSIVLDSDILWSSIKKCVTETTPPEFESIEFFDLYEGKGVEKGKKAMAFRIVYRAFDRTLTDGEVQAFVDAILARLKKQFDAELRSR